MSFQEKYNLKLSRSPNMEQHEDDIVIVGSYRTPICKAKRGNLANLKNNDIICGHLKNTLEKINLSPKMIDYVCLGNVLSEMNGTVDAKHACLRAGIDLKTPIMTINRQCASGLEAFEIVKNMLQLNKIEIGLVGGFESMTMHSLPLGDINDYGDNKYAEGCKMSMIETADKISSHFDLSRNEIDEYAFNSHSRAYNSIKNGLFSDEILPLNDIKDDDCVRSPNREKMASLKPVNEYGTTTAANASQLSDGCSLALLMKRKVAEMNNLPIQGVLIDYVAVGVDPSIMGIGPVEAIPMILSRNKLSIDDIECFEINEAFGSQALYCTKTLAIPISKVNIKGGAIALGHPLGCTGARLVSTLLRNYEKGYGIVSLCAGTGHGVAALIYKE